MNSHHKDCPWQVEQYPHECTCKALPMQTNPPPISPVEEIAGRLSEARKPGDAAIFTIVVHGDGLTSLHTKASPGIPAYLTIDKAIAALLAERKDMRNCPVHADAPQQIACPFCGDVRNYPDLNFSGKAWTTCLNPNCRANAPQEIWNLRAPQGNAS